MTDAYTLVKKLEMLPHPEGGFYKEIFRSTVKLNRDELPYGYKSERRLATSIYYMLTEGQKSKFHRIRSDELWYYHYGCSLKIHEIDREGNKHTHFLGLRIDRGEKPQVIIPAGNVFAAELLDNGEFGLYGCMVSPGFEFNDFELFEEEDLIQTFPNHEELIKKFCQ